MTFSYTTGTTHPSYIKKTVYGQSPNLYSEVYIVQKTGIQHSVLKCRVFPQELKLYVPHEHKGYSIKFELKSQVHEFLEREQTLFGKIRNRINLYWKSIANYF